jgi:hypothetical protein
MKTFTLVLVGVVAMAAGCATSGEVRGSALVPAQSAKVFAAGPAVVHAYSLDRGGEVFLAPALAGGTDADCAGAKSTGPRTAVKVDVRNVVRVSAGQVACVTTDNVRPYELIWHAWSGPAAPTFQIADNLDARAAAFR